MKHFVVIVLLSLATFSFGQRIDSVLAQIIDSSMLYGYNQLHMDSLIEFKEYIPDGDSIETIKFELASYTPGESISFSQYYLTGQTGFMHVELRKMEEGKGKEFFLLSIYGGTQAMHNQTHIGAYELSDSGYRLIPNKLLSAELNMSSFLKQSTPDSIVAKMNNYLCYKYVLSRPESPITIAVEFGPCYTVIDSMDQWMLSEPILLDPANGVFEIVKYVE